MVSQKWGAFFTASRRRRKPRRSRRSSPYFVRGGGVDRRLFERENIGAPQAFVGEVAQADLAVDQGRRDGEWERKLRLHDGFRMPAHLGRRADRLISLM